MRSPAERLRWFEPVFRGIAYAALLLAFYLAVQARTVSPTRRVITPSTLPAYLAQSVASLDSIALVGDTALDPLYRDWLAAVRESGRGVSWTGSIAPIAVEVAPIVDPVARERLFVAAPSGPIRLADSLGALDSADASGGGAGFESGPIHGPAQILVSGQRAVALPLDSLAPRRIAVLGRPTWETKFVVAALEERGWLVDVRIPLGPEASVVQGAPLRLDTAAVAAVVALDDAAGGEAGRIKRFVQDGGGLVLGPLAAKLAGFATLRVGTSGVRVAPLELEPPVENPRRGLALVAVSRLEPGGVVLERQRGSIALAARRVGMGRVLQLGYEDTWRWRMSGPDGAVEAHRRWWAGLVGAVAYRATFRGVRSVSPQDAPLVRTIARLGPPDSVVGRRAGSPSSRLPSAMFLFVVAGLALLAEWGSRRWRGAV